MSSEQAPRLVLSAGEPAGIGPDLCLEWSRSPRQADVVVAADIDLLFERAKQLRIPIEVDAWEPGQPITRDPGRLSVWSVSQCPNKQAGRLDPANAGYVLDTLGAATDACIDGTFDALVTGPVHKGNIADAGHDFSGHTEFLQERCGVDRVVMMLATEGLRVALVTTHLPLKDVPGAITRNRLSEVTRILHGDLHKHFGLDAPRILVAGLNPHAGEGGHMGREEIDVIEPTLETLRSEGMDLVGPLPADTLFTPHWLEQADAVLAMYHDQGLPLLKYKGFGNAVNITLGLPIIRTSVDHGTAIDLAGTGRADGGSLRTALATAERMALHRRQEGTA